MAHVNDEQMARVAAFLKANPPKTRGMDFMGEMYPSLNHPQAIDFFFFACLHQYGFWYGDDEGYVEPMIGNIAEKKLKGSDLLWTLLKRKLDADPEFFLAKRLASVTPKELGDVLADDAATSWPNFEERFALTRQYGWWLVDTSQTSANILAEANAGRSLGCFLDLLVTSPFGADKLQKKQMLLAMALKNRPERFLWARDVHRWRPIVDYHLMRVALRLGLVELWEPLVSDFIVRRRWIDGSVEAEIRDKIWQAICEVIRQSELPMATIDETFWMARRYCPEMTEPECDQCLFTSVCAKRTKLFQPVFRTTAY